MDKRLYAKAKANVLRKREKKLDDEIKKEYNHLLHESEIIDMDDSTLKRFKELYKIAMDTKITGIGHSYLINKIRTSLKNKIDKRRYHPDDIERYEKYLKVK